MPMKMSTKIGGKSLTIFRVTLKGWAKLDTLRRKMVEDASKRDFDAIFNTLILFIETSSSPSIDWKVVPWYDFLETYSKVNEINKPTIAFPILEEHKKDGKDMPWEYPGRAWFFWLHLLAGYYGWEETKIAELDIDTALGLYQETLIEEQFQREWEWGLSEKSHQYNSSTKKSEFKALERPHWMLPMTPKELPTVKIRKDMIPMGLVVEVGAKSGS